MPTDLHDTILHFMIHAIFPVVNICVCIAHFFIALITTIYGHTDRKATPRRVFLLKGGAMASLLQPQDSTYQEWDLASQPTKRTIRYSPRLESSA